MKHPLTSKERRGLLAVAAAALLCIASAFIFRNCSSGFHHDQWQESEPFDSGIQITDSISEANKLPESENNGKIKEVEKAKDAKLTKGNNKNKNTKESKNKTNKKKAPKAYPVRDPLSEPCN